MALTGLCDPWNPPLEERSKLGGAAAVVSFSAVIQETVAQFLGRMPFLPSPPRSQLTSLKAIEIPLVEVIDALVLMVP